MRKPVPRNADKREKPGETSCTCRESAGSSVNVIREFEVELKSGDDLVLTSVSAPGARLLEIAKHGEAFQPKP